MWCCGYHYCTTLFNKVWTKSGFGQVCDSENLHYWFQLEIRAITFLLVNHFAKQFIITNHTHILKLGFRQLFQRIFIFHRPFTLIFIFMFPVKEQSFSNQYLKDIFKREYVTKKVGFFLFYFFFTKYCLSDSFLSFFIQILPKARDTSNSLVKLYFNFGIFLKTPS